MFHVDHFTDQIPLKSSWESVYKACRRVFELRGLIKWEIIVKFLGFFDKRPNILYRIFLVMLVELKLLNLMQFQDLLLICHYLLQEVKPAISPLR